MIDKVVYNGWLKLCKRQIGNNTYEILHDYNAVAALIVNEYGEILLVKQFRPAVMSTTLEIPAGSMDTVNENEAECLARELKEEANLDILPQELHHIISYKPNLGFSKSKMHIFMARVNKNQITNEKTPNHLEECEVEWMHLNELEGYIIEGKIQDVKTIIVYLYMKAHNLI